MSDLSKKTLIPSDDTKNYIENYWTKRADAFAALRRQELHSEKYSQWQREIVQHLPPAKQLRILDVGCGAGFGAMGEGYFRLSAFGSRENTIEAMERIEKEL